jgi:hypothetical protein
MENPVSSLSGFVGRMAKGHQGKAEKQRARKTAHHAFSEPFIGSGGGIRTPDQPVNSRLLYR